MGATPQTRSRYFGDIKRLPPLIDASPENSTTNSPEISLGMPAAASISSVAAMGAEAGGEIGKATGMGGRHYNPGTALFFSRYILLVGASGDDIPLYSESIESGFPSIIVLILY